DTHPCLRDRLSAIGERPDAFIPLRGPSAAEYFLGDSLAPLTAMLNQRWWARAAHEWRERYRRAEERRARLRELEAKAEREPLDAEEAWQRAVLSEALGDGADLVGLYEEVCHLDPCHARATFGLGRLLVSRGERGGIRLLERAMELRPDWVGVGC